MPLERRILLDGQWRLAGRTPIPTSPPGEISWPVTPTPWQPFDSIERSTLVTFDRKVWAHAFVTFPIGGDGRANGADGTYPLEGWWGSRMPGGSRNPTYGGELRDRYLDPFAPRPRTEPNWWLLDRAQEITWARDTAVIDGFTIDWLNLNDGTGDNRTGQVREYAQALQYLGYQNDFKMILMPDGTTSICDGGNYSAFLAKTIELLSTYPDVWYRDVDGRWIIAPYYPEGAPSSVVSGSRVTNTSATATTNYWTQYRNDLEAAGYPIRFWMCYVRVWYNHATTAPALSGLATLNSRWGDRDPLTTGNSSPSNRGAALYSRTTYGKGWMQPVAPQDNRCNTSESPKFWEAGNTEQWREAWYSAISPDGTGPADMVQIPTLNDFREHAHVGPSVHHGYVWLDLANYFGQAYKTGEWPPIVRDGIYLSHRLHRTDDYTATGTQTQFMTLTGGTPVRNNIEVLAFLTDLSDTTIEILVDDVVVETFTPTTVNREIIGENVFVVTTALPSMGEISARVMRSGSPVAGTEVTSPIQVTDTPVAQTMHYIASSSLREA